VSVRPAEPADVPEILAMIHELAEFEELSDQVVCTEEDLRRALFGPGAVVTVTLAVDEQGAVAGHALWFRTFSTFLGRTGIWLEDLYVRPAFRRQGLARALLDHLRAATTGRVEWEVLDWNAPAITFYDGLGAQPLTGWTKYRWVGGD
jgi:GNAT superfamily N-acetyltransferase